MQKPVTSGIDVSPALPGAWFWNSDKELQFTPRDDWPVDGRFTVRFVKNGLFANQVVLENYRFTFKSQPFSASIADSQFYQDPRDPNLKKLVATREIHPSGRHGAASNRMCRSRWRRTPSTSVSVATAGTSR